MPAQRPDATQMVAWLAPRRECLAGAQQTVQTVADTIERATDCDALRDYLRPIVAERLELLDLALRQFDAALAGTEPPEA